MKVSDNTVEWVKIGSIQHLSLMSRDVLCYSSGCFINFLNVYTGDEMTLDVNLPSENGDGVGALEGHRTHYVFAYSENCRHPTLYVKIYPSMKIIGKVPDGPPEGYTGMTFSETSLLITVSNLPDYILTIYNWRKGEKVGELHSNLNFERQLIRCCWSKPVYVAQICRNHNKLLLWDVFTCCKAAVLAEHEIELPENSIELRFHDTLWTTEGGLYVLDSKGCIYYVVNEKSLQNVVNENLTGDSPTSMCWVKGGIAVSGPNNEIRHYKKSGTWERDWTITFETGIKSIMCNKSEFFVVVTVDDEIIKVDSPEEVNYVKKDDNLFNGICMVHPAGQYVVALRKNRILNVYQTDTGQLICKMELKHKALTVAENPEFPYIAVGYESGLLELISVFNPEKLSVMASFNLSNNPIRTVKFFEQGRIIVTACINIGEFFLIEGLPGTQMKIITNINTKFQIVDYMMVASKNCYRLFLIPATAIQRLAGDKIIRYCIIARDNISVKEYRLDNKEFLYHRLICSAKSNRDRVFYALPINSRSIHELEIRRGDDVIRFHSEIKTGHLLRKCKLNLTKYYALTSGYDGFVIVRDRSFQQKVGMALPNHRYLAGVKKAYIHPLGTHIVSLGRDGALVCTKVVKNIIDANRKRMIDELMASTKMALMFKRPTIGFKPDSCFKNKTWLEVEAILQTQKEEEICAPEKAILLQEFNDIKTVLNNLVTNNIEGPDNEKIDLIEFFLDTALYNQKKDLNKQTCKSTETYLKAMIVAQDKVSKYLMENCWNVMRVQNQVVNGIFSKTETKNFPLLPVDPDRTKQLSWIEEQRKVEQFLKLKDCFYPWLILPPDQLEEYCQPLCFKLQDYENTKLVSAPMDEAAASQSTETQIALAGSSTQTYLTINSAHFEQREIVSFYQCQLEQMISERDILKLKCEFNKIFDDLVKLKQREMFVIKERNDRLRHIISEHNYFSDHKISLNIIYPQWSQREIPEMITKVTKQELSVTPYISPSEQAMLDAKAAEEERIRLALLADDFRERALMAMMNGVLEVRWEDELKKDVPLPKCMVEKQPENYNEEDLRSIKDYEEKVTFLNSERERYKNLLDGEFTKVSIFVRDSIRKFNQKVKDISDHRMQMDSAVSQEHLKINRNRYTEDERFKMFQKKERLKKSMVDTEHAMINLKKTINFVQEAISECRTNLETLQMKEKLLEKSFKKDFQDSSPVLQELAVKLYKKRPKLGFKQINSYTIMFELARCIVVQDKSLILNSDCFDYMRALDQMDLFVGLPPTIDENTFGHICKHRRLRIEYEIKVRAHQSQIADGETTIGTFQRRLNLHKENLVKLTAELQQLRTDYLYLMHNLQLQIVLRRGLVELPLTGKISDFDDAILVPKKEIENINKLILEAGNKKIQTIMQNMAFRRNIMATEWEHRKLRLVINDLTEQLEDVESVKLGKDMQLYLKAKALGRKTELESYEVEIERIIAAFENRIQSKKDKYMKLHKMIENYKQGNNALDKEINSINIDVCHLEMIRNKELQDKEQDVLQARMEGLLKRSSLVEQIQQNHGEILVLQTELELLRLKTYPTFKYKLINPNQ